jgi:hypothetical protein
LELRARNSIRRRSCLQPHLFAPDLTPQQPGVKLSAKRQANALAPTTSLRHVPLDRYRQTPSSTLTHRLTTCSSRFPPPTSNYLSSSFLRHSSLSAHYLVPSSSTTSSDEGDRSPRPRNRRQTYNSQILAAAGLPPVSPPAERFFASPRPPVVVRDRLSLSPLRSRPKAETMDSIFNQPKPVVTIPDEVKNALVRNAAPYPLPEGKRFQYGTAGVSSSIIAEEQTAEPCSTVSHESVSNLHSSVSISQGDAKILQSLLIVFQQRRWPRSCRVRGWHCFGFEVEKTQ